MSITSGPACKRGFVAQFHFFFYLQLDLVHRMCPGPSIITCTSFPRPSSSARPALSTPRTAQRRSIGEASGAQSIAREKLTSCFLKILQMSSKCSYRKFSFLCAFIHCASSAPPADDPGDALRTSGTNSRSTRHESSCSRRPARPGLTRSFQMQAIIGVPNLALALSRGKRNED